jgi:hypothetical protein
MNMQHLEVSSYVKCQFVSFHHQYFISSWFVLLIISSCASPGRYSLLSLTFGHRFCACQQLNSVIKVVISHFTTLFIVCHNHFDVLTLFHHYYCQKSFSFPPFIIACRFTSSQVRLASAVKVIRSQVLIVGADRIFCSILHFFHLYLLSCQSFWSQYVI